MYGAQPVSLEVTPSIEQGVELGLLEVNPKLDRKELPLLDLSSTSAFDYIAVHLQSASHHLLCTSHPRTSLSIGSYLPVCY